MKSLERQKREAVALFRSFNKRDPVGDEIGLLGDAKTPTVVLQVGNMLQISYKALRDGNSYRHDFRQPYAKIYTNCDGTQIFISGGGYRFSKWGFLK